jgi:hypothetical protein
MAQVLTMVSARIAPDREAEVIDGFSAALRAGMPERRHTSLLRGDDGLWCVMTFWRNRSDLDHYLATTPRPFALRLLESAGGEPAVETLEVTLDTNTSWWP